jgi:phage shock protein C
MSVRRLYRSNNEIKVAGVCSGLGQYFQVDPTLVRLFFVFLTFYNFLGVWVYLVLALLIPKAPEGMEDSVNENILVNNSDNKRLIGGAMVALGTLALISELNISWFKWFDHYLLLPIIMILVGIVLLTRIFITE